ncbi:MAG TPA: ZIP family metal transporter [Firmicutes bacterium]|nr:ZIP family metal transporter [Bacillota bacterium]
MNITWIYALISVVIVSAISLIAVIFLALGEDKIRKLLLFMVSFAAGGLFGDAFIHLIPESFAKLGSGLFTSLLILSGILFFFILEKFIHWRHCHNINFEEHTHPMVMINLIGDGAHNLIDGMLIAASYAISIPLGIATTLAVILHEIPHEIGNFGVLVHGGLAVKKALLFNFATALTAVAGAIVALSIGPLIHGFSIVLIPITAGGFIYIAGSDLIPELKHEVELSHSVLQLISIILGIGVMSLLILLD